MEIGHISVRCYETLYLTKRARQQPIVEKIVIFNMEYQVPLSFSTVPQINTCVVHVACCDNLATSLLHFSIEKLKCLKPSEGQKNCYLVNNPLHSSVPLLLTVVRHERFEGESARLAHVDAHQCVAAQVVQRLKFVAAVPFAQGPAAHHGVEEQPGARREHPGSSIHQSGLGGLTPR